MSIVGVSGSPINNSNTDRITKALLEKSGKETKFIKLSTLSFDPCRGCAHLCAPTKMCGRKDEAQTYIKDIRDSEVLILSSPINRGHMTAWMFSFLSRLWCLAHIKSLLEDKPVVLVSLGLEDEKTRNGREIYEDTFIMEHKPKVIGEIYYQTSMPPCFKCGVAYQCRRGGLWHHLVGCDEEALKNFKITPDKFRKWEDDPRVVEKVNKIGKLLSEI